MGDEMNMRTIDKALREADWQPTVLRLIQFGFHRRGVQKTNL